MDRLLKYLGFPSQSKVRYYEPRPKFFKWKRGFGDGKLEACRVSINRKPIQELKSILVLFLGGLTMFAAIAIFNKNENFKRDFISPVRKTLNSLKPPETKVGLPVQTSLDDPK